GGAEGVVSDQDVRPSWCERPAGLAEGMVAGDVEDQVPLPTALRVVLAGVVDDVIRAERAHQRQLAGVVDAGDVRAVRLGELERDGAHAAGGAVEEDPVAGRYATLREVVERDQPGGRHRRGLLEADP